MLSKAGKVKYSLDSGPDGMSITSDGVLRWNVPAGFNESAVGVIVSIEDGSGQSLFHAFEIRLPAQPTAPDPAGAPKTNI